MPKTFDQSKDEVARLVKRFETNKNSYQAAGYKEAHARQEFIDPLFMALGWDVHNESGIAPDYREVVIEDSLEIEGQKKAPDYVFRVGRDRKFFVEAKKPGVDIKNASSPAYQLRRYAWSAKLPLSVLTDFEELAVYDCRVRPSDKDKASVARINYFSFIEYADRWKEVYDLFSRDAVWGGAYDEFVRDGKKGRGTSEVDSEFLKEIESWRDALAKNIALRNESLSIDQLNDAVQKTIDRIIFMRMAEDRKIEEYKTLERISEKENIYASLLQLFSKADARYNSGLFDFSKNGDRITTSISIDDKVLRPILSGLYFPKSPYEFSVLPAETLGNIYEQFLGKVIRLTDGHRAKVEEKPEVKKAGGVYYTPAYIVDYIVKNTVGEAVKGKSPKELKGFRVLDMACGSGSFLLGAYQYLLEYYLSWYVVNTPAKHNKEVWNSGDSYRLTTAERKRILVEHIYGVDIDRQAVEVTKLSLLLKVLEGESDQTIGQQIQLFQERVLPSLEDNIKCGNSLIGPDYFSGKLIPDDEELRRVNPFDWNGKDGFPEAMKSGGFDCVIGNPPYVFGRDWKSLGITDEIKNYLGAIYQSSPYQLDMFSIFMEKTHKICNLNGYVGLIVPNVWLNNIYSSSTRSFILSNSKNLKISSPEKSVFEGITVDTVVYTCQKSDKAGEAFIIASIDEASFEKNIIRNVVSEFLNGQKPIPTNLCQDSVKVISRINNFQNHLSDFVVMTRGVHPYRLGGYGISAFAKGCQIQKDLDERPYHSKTYKKGSRPFIYGKNLSRYSEPIINEYINYGNWLAEPRDPQFFQDERIYSRKILGDRLIVTIVKDDSVADQQVYISKPIAHLQAAFLAGILSSRLISFYIKKFYNEENDAFPQIKVGQLKNIPICVVNLDEITDKSKHDRMVVLVETMLDLHKKKVTAKDDGELKRLQRLIDSTDSEIDRLVYDLYGLTEEEIRIVEK